MSCCGQSRSQWQAQQNRQKQPARPIPQTPQTPARAAPAAPASGPAVQARHLASNPPTVWRSPSAVDTTALAPAHGVVSLRYLARSAILVQGAASGRAYRFSELAPVQAVARADAAAMLASGHFRREA